MSYRPRWFVVAVLFVSLVGCDALDSALDLALDFVRPTTVTVTLENTGADFDVEATVLYADNRLIPEFLLKEVGVESTSIIRPGDRTSFTQSCDDIEAVMVEDADLLQFGFSTLETQSDVLRDGEDFECGDEIVFTFTHSAASNAFDLVVTIR